MLFAHLPSACVRFLMGVAHQWGSTSTRLRLLPCLLLATSRLHPSAAAIVRLHLNILSNPNLPCICTCQLSFPTSKLHYDIILTWTTRGQLALLQGHQQLQAPLQEVGLKMYHQQTQAVRQMEAPSSCQSLCSSSCSLPHHMVPQSKLADFF
uniref:Non-specific lipid transfer protein A n=1 Tax=Rhizophora mucronata TaxID=61149 RepID=A0A2P2INK0_RHIMU